MNSSLNPITESLYSTLYEMLGERLLAEFESRCIEELMCNPDGRVFIRYQKGEMVEVTSFSEECSQIIVRTVASLNEKDIDPKKPLIEGEISRLNARFSAVLPPLSKGTCFCIRVLKALNLSFEELFESGFMTVKQSEILQYLIESRLNFLICGQTGCGKTSFINSILNKITELEPFSRIVCIEDTPELKLNAANCVNLFASRTTSMSELLKASLRLSPDRIIVGEVRSSEALDMIDAFSTGHKGGFASMHAGSLLQCLDRLKLLVSKNQNAPEKGIEELIALSVDAVVVLTKKPKRTIESISLIKGFRNDKFEYEVIG